MTPPIENESGIVWLHDPLQFRYLRESTYTTTRRNRFPTKRKGRMVVGYATHHKQEWGVNGVVAYSQRFWYLSEWDRDLDPDGPYAVKNFKLGPMPSEAVVPASIEAGKPSTDYYGSPMWHEDFDERERIEEQRRRRK